MYIYQWSYNPNLFIYSQHFLFTKKVGLPIQQRNGDKMADGKIIALVVVGILVGAGIGAGIGFAVFGNKSEDQTYYFYLYLGDNNPKTGWYSATAANADDAVEKAFEGKDTGFKWSYGYPAFGDGYWYTAAYYWNTLTKKAAEASIAYDSDNGWVDFYGWDETDTPENEKHLHQTNCNIFFFSQYAGGIDPTMPCETTLWITATGTPFAA